MYRSTTASLEYCRTPSFFLEKGDSPQSPLEKGYSPTSPLAKGGLRGICFELNEELAV